MLVSILVDTWSGLSNWQFILTSSTFSFYEGEGRGGGAGSTNDVQSSSMDAVSSVHHSASLHRQTTNRVKVQPTL